MHTTWVASTRLTTPTIEARIEATWQRLIEQRAGALFDGPVCRLERFEERDGALHLTLSRESYKPFVGTNLYNPELALAHGRAVLVDPVGVSVALVTSDGKLVMGRRGGRVAYHPHRVHPFAGALEPDEADDVFRAAERELTEELALPPGRVSDLRCVALAEDRQIMQPELILLARTSEPADALARQVDDAEHLGMFACDATVEALEVALRSEEQFTPIARAAILALCRNLHR